MNVKYRYDIPSFLRFSSKAVLKRARLGSSNKPISARLYVNEGNSMQKATVCRTFAIQCLFIALAGCQSPPPPPPPPPVPVPVTRASSIDGADTSRYATAVERIFAEGLDLYDKGEYSSAIKKFQSPELSGAWPELRVRTLKYLGFSYCVTNDLRACQQAFYDAIQLNPQFKLLSSEEGHPIWGPVFQKARVGPPEPSQPPQPAARRGLQAK